MEIIHKSFPALLIKADDELGIVESIVAVMGNIDHANDRIWKNSFVKTLLERFNKVKVLDNHNNYSINNAIGKPLEAREVDRSELPEQLLIDYPNATGGLYTKTQYLLDTPEGLGAYKRIKSGVIDEYSIGFVIPKGKFDFSTETIDGIKKTIRNIREVVLYEYSPVLWAANSATTTLGVKMLKDLETKAVSLSKYIDKLRSSFESLYLVEVEEGEYKYTTSQYWVVEIFDEYIYVCPSYRFRETSEYPFYKVFYRYDETNDMFVFEGIENWIGGSYQFVAGVKSLPVEVETKAGRVLSGANMEKVKAALEALNALYEAGLIEDETEDETEEMSEEKSESETLDSMLDNNKNVQDENSENKADTVNTPITLTALELERIKELYLMQIKRFKNA